MGRPPAARGVGRVAQAGEELGQLVDGLESLDVFAGKFHVVTKVGLH